MKTKKTSKVEQAKSLLNKINDSDLKTVAGGPHMVVDGISVLTQTHQLYIINDLN